MKEKEISRENSQKMKRLEKLLEDEISEMAKYIKLKLSFGIDIFSIRLPDTTIELKKIILYIFNKIQRNPIDNIILRQYLISYPEFIDTLKLREQISDPKELLLKISQNLIKEEIYSDRVVFYNGQYGKCFYLILEGEVSVLIPYEFKLRLTDKQVLKYMYYLLQHKEYELIRLMFENNKHILNDIDYRENTLFLKLKSYSERGLPSNVDIEKISTYDYLQRFEYFSLLEKRQKEIAIKLEQKGKEEKKEQQKDKNKVKTNYFTFFLRENMRQKTGYVKRADTKTFETDEDDEEIIKNKNFFYEEEETFSIYKYFEVIKLTKGKCFGELALTKEGKKRNATIITTKNCIFGILHKDAYQAFIKEAMDKARKVNVEHLLKCRLFHGCNSEKFETHFFSCFKLMKRNKGQYLFKQGEHREFIYFLKKGEIQLEIFCNCFHLENIMNNLGYIDDSFDSKELVKSKKLEQFCKINRNFKVVILSDEVIGLEEHTLYPDNLEYAFTGICASYCEMFALDVKFFSKLMDEKIIKTNYIHLVKERKLRLAERIYNLKNSVIMQQYSIMRDNERYSFNDDGSHNLINKAHKKINLKLNSKDNLKLKTKFNENTTIYKIINETEKRNFNLKSLDNRHNHKKTISPYDNKRGKTLNKESFGTLSRNKLESNHRNKRTPSFKVNRFQIFEANKRKLKLKEQINNIQKENSFINKMKKNNIKTNNHFNSTYSSKFTKNSNEYPYLSSNLKTERQKVKESTLRVSLKTDNMLAKDDFQDSSSKKLKLNKNIKYVNFGNIRIPKILLKQSNIFNPEIDKINEIIINNYEKITPSSCKINKKYNKKTQSLLINAPEYNSEENKNKISFSNSLNRDFKKKFFPLPVIKNKNNINFESLDEDDIINFFEKK